MARITGLTANSKKHFLLDAGAIYKNYDPATDTPATATTKLIGATVGGSSFSLTPEVRQMPVDGAKGPTKGLETIDSWTAVLTTTVKEITVNSLALALTTATATTSTSPADYTKITLSEDIPDTAYLTNITWVGKIAGSDKPVMFVLKNALCLNGLTINMADKSEGNVPVTLTAHYDVADLEAVPVDIYMPDIA